MEIARQVAEAYRTASSAVEVYRVALTRITPIVGASFASVFLRDDDDPGLLRLACAHNWPQASARYLGEMRIREGRGPTGRAVRTGRPVEVSDVFQDPALRDWRDPARELGFVSMTSLPLAVEGRVLGALSFYFRERQVFDDHARGLLGVVAGQLAATAERARRGARARAGDGVSVRPGPAPGSR
jgi:GAF domain-containing protein